MVALERAGMVHGNTFLWELKNWAISQEVNWTEQKKSTEKLKLEQLKKATEVQLEEKMNDKVNSYKWIVPCQMKCEPF